jgi:hypothetical protein
MNRISKSLLVLVLVVELILFFPLWINALVVPVHILIHALLVFGLLTVKRLNLTMTPNQFASLVSYLPFALLLIESVFVNSVDSMPALQGLLVVGGYTLAICSVEFFIAKFQYTRWLNRTTVLN